MGTSFSSKDRAINDIKNQLKTNAKNGKPKCASWFIDGDERFSSNDQAHVLSTFPGFNINPRYSHMMLIDGQCHRQPIARLVSYDICARDN